MPLGNLCPKGVLYKYEVKIHNRGKPVEIRKLYTCMEYNELTKITDYLEMDKTIHGKSDDFMLKLQKMSNGLIIIDDKEINTFLS